ncbi:MAG: Single-stranded-DNA-specific exonuclease RecJ, partial [Cyanobacteriota bacterium]
PAPRLLIRNAWFSNTAQSNLIDAKDRKVSFIKTTFNLEDDTATAGFPGEWWGHYADEIPAGRCDVVVELDYHAPTEAKKGPKPGYYHVKLVDVRPAVEDFRAIQPNLSQMSDDLAKLAPCPLPTTELGESPIAVWTELVGLAKYLVRTQTPVDRSRLLSRLGISELSLDLGLQALTTAGFSIAVTESPRDPIQITAASPQPMDDDVLQHFLEAVAEEQFRQRYRLQQGIMLEA